jgi:trimeric autotransporter adhesin
MNSTYRTLQTNFLDGTQSIPNYIGNGKATNATTAGWATYADAAGTAPVDGTGGSPNVTISTSSSSPLSGDNSFTLVKDAANRQGQGWSYDFTIASSDQAKVLQIQFDYLISSGTFVAGSSTTDSDVTCWIYDVTNAQVIQPSTFRLYSNSATTSNTSIGNFQTASNSTSYRLIFHVGSTSASAYTLKVDSVSVSPTQYVYGSPITDWQSYTPTFTGFGTVTGNETQWRRVGSDVEIRSKFTAGTSTATEARVSLPSGLTSADTTKIPSIQLAGSLIRSTSLGSFASFYALIEPSVTYATFSTWSGSAGGLTKALGNTLSGSSDTFSFTARIPIQGLSSCVQMSDSADTRVVVAEMTSTSATSIPNTTWTLIPFGTVVEDSHASYSTSTNLYTIPVSGRYRVTTILNWATGTTGSRFTAIYKNGTYLTNIGVASRTPENINSGGSVIRNFNAGDTIGIYAQHNDGGSLSLAAPTVSSNQTVNSFMIERISGPVAIATTETIAASYYASATGTSSTTQTINFNTKLFDTHLAVSTTAPSGGTGTWKFTAPVSGYYQCNVLPYCTANVQYSIYKNDTKYAIVDFIDGANSGMSGCAAYLIDLIAGDYIDFRFDSSNTFGGNASKTTNGVSSIQISRQK